MQRRKYAVKEKPYIPQSGEFALTPTAAYLQDRGWVPFQFDGELKWIDPLKPFDISNTESEALDIQLRRDVAKEAGRYSQIKR